MRAALVIALVALFSDASAAPSTTNVSVTKTNRFTPAPLVTTPFKPELDASAVLSTAFSNGPIRSEQEQILIDLINATPDKEAEEKSEYLFRLGELYAKQTAFHRQQGDPTKTAAFLAKAKATYQRLFAMPAARNYPRLDVALFLYGYTLHAANLDAEAKPIFDRLVKEIPNSKHAPDAYLVMADAEFAATKLVDADMNYQRVLKWPRPQSAYAFYMRGYIELAQQKPTAYQRFLELLGILRDDPTTTQELLDATRSAVLRGLVQQNKIELGILLKADKDHAVEDMQHLAELYSARGKHERAAATYRELIKAQPANADLCSWRLGLAKATVLGTTLPKVELCTTDVEAFEQWASSAGVDVK